MRKLTDFAPVEQIYETCCWWNTTGKLKRIRKVFYRMGYTTYDVSRMQTSWNDSLQSAFSLTTWDLIPGPRVMNINACWQSEIFGNQSITPLKAMRTKSLNGNVENHAMQAMTGIASTMKIVIIHNDLGVMKIIVLQSNSINSMVSFYPMNEIQNHFI